MAAFNFVRGVNNSFVKNDEYPSVAVTKYGTTLMKDIYTCDGFNIDVFFQYDTKGKPTVIDTIHVISAKFLPLELRIQRKTEGKPQKIMIQLGSQHGYDDYVLDFFY